MQKETVHIETPEKILFTYTIADTGQRIMAYLIDVVLQAVFFAIIFIILLISALSVYVTGLFEIARQTGALFMAFIFLLQFFIQWGYFIFFEVMMDGQSPGKKVLKIRVIKVDGDFMDFPTIVLRNLLRAVDGFPALHLFGGGISIIDKKSRRLGDFVAGTLVVDDIKYNFEEPSFHTELSAESNALQKVNYKNRLSEEELFVIRRFLNEKEKMPPEIQLKVALKLAEDVKKRLDHKMQISKPILFLEGVYKSHTYADDK